MRQNQNLVQYFVPRAYAVYALDPRGHGRSDGKRVANDTAMVQLASASIAFKQAELV
ncbi:MAG: serine aminopeptidase domain-containing protein [Dehalococcoidia bacterium]